MTEATEGKVIEIGPRFRLVPFDRITLGPERVYLVKGIIPRAGLVVVWGPPKCGKSFWTFDLVMHVALGWPYRSKRVQRGSVVYLALEGGKGFEARIEAFRRRFLSEDADPVPFFLIADALNLVKEHADLIGCIRLQLKDSRPAAVVIDTLNRSLAGSESDDKDMAAYIRAADAIRHAFGCVVIVVHHCGVDVTRPRGHTSLAGAVDAQLAVKRDAADNVIMTVERMKDGPDGETIASRLEAFEVGYDEDGDPVTSCIVLPADIEAGTAKPTRKLPNAAKIAHRALIEALDRHGEPAPASTYIPAMVRIVTEEQWRAVCYKLGISGGERRAREVAFDRARTRLVADQLVGTYEGLYWVARNP
jgi:hypothetical protein